MTRADFLHGTSLRKNIRLPESCPYDLIGLALGSGSSALEVLAVDSASEPRLPNVRSLWKQRNNRRAAPLVVVVRYNETATLCGPAGDDPPAYPGVDLG